jgi:3-methyladenine DNA glycosylase/8-oxoguanine DNA glycosylase
MNIHIPTPAGFDFRRTVNSHGWYDLPPFEQTGDGALARVLDVGGRTPVTVTITESAGGLDVRASRRLNKTEAARVARDVRHMLRLDDDMTRFYEAVSSAPEFAWIARDGAGRLLRSPTVYEDLVKSVCTTNCTWALTKKMVAGLVENLGREAGDGRRAFPTPAAMADAPAEFYRDTVRAGYRSEYLKELAVRVAGGEIDPESWLGSDLPTDRLKREMKRVKGVGDYAAENLLKLVGRYDVLALDSWVRAQFTRKRHRGKACEDAKIARFYSRFADWRGLALWCDMTEEWFEKS